MCTCVSKEQGHLQGRGVVSPGVVVQAAAMVTVPPVSPHDVPVRSDDPRRDVTDAASIDPPSNVTGVVSIAPLSDVTNVVSIAPS